MRRVKADDGNVIVEFIGITVALLVPLSIIASSSIMVANAYLSTDVSARTAAAVTSASATVTVGCVRYLCLKYTVSEIRHCLVFFTSMRLNVE